jgi:hypothetical protein
MIEFRSLAHLDNRIGPLEARRDTSYRLKLDAEKLQFYALALAYNRCVVRLNESIAALARAELDRRDEAILHRAFPDDHKG